ncbi:hypothetical protein Tco_0431797 [Tanacetum coccineum]
MNKATKVTFAKTSTTSNNNTQIQVDVYQTQTTNKPSVPSTNVKRFTNASRSKPCSETKNNRIMQPLSSNQKYQKVEAHIRNAKPSLTKENSKSKSMCLTCNKCYFDARHDFCVVQHLSELNDRARAKAVKSIKMKEWKPTGKMFKNVGYKWVPIGRTFTIVETKCPLTRFTSTKIVPPRKPVKSTIITNIKPSSASQWRPKETNHASSSSAPKIVESRTTNHLGPNNYMGSNVSISTCSSSVQYRSYKSYLGPCFNQDFDFNQPPHYSPSQPQTYSCELCGNDAHYGYDCPPQVPFISNPDPCYNQDLDNFLQTSLNFQQQYLCCENCGGPHETFQCQPLNQNFYEPNHCYNSNSFGFDQSQPSQYPVIRQSPQATSTEALQARENLMKSIQTFLKKFNRISFRETPKVLLLAWENFFEIKHACKEKQHQPEDIQELLRKLLKDVQIISEELADYINIPNRNYPAFYHDDDEDDDEEYTIAITVVLPTEEPDNSLSMGEEHLITIPETESDKVIKSSVEDFVPIPSITPDSELVSLEEVKDDILHEKLLNIYLLIAKIESLNENPTPDCVLKSPSTFPIPNKILYDAPIDDLIFDPGDDNDEIDTFLDVDISMDIEDGYHDSEGDILYFESLLSDDTTLRDQACENYLIYKEKTKNIHDSKIKNRVFNVSD